jgi:hypothetical protein
MAKADGRTTAECLWKGTPIVTFGCRGGTPPATAGETLALRRERYEGGESLTLECLVQR